MTPRPPSSTLFPYTTLFRSDVDQAELRLRLSASLDVARRELIDATERGEGGRAALARHADCIDGIVRELDRKSTRLNSSHLVISYAVFCLKKKIKTTMKSED